MLCDITIKTETSQYIRCIFTPIEQFYIFPPLTLLSRFGVEFGLFFVLWCITRIDSPVEKKLINQ